MFHRRASCLDAQGSLPAALPYLLRAGKRAGEELADTVGDETARLAGRGRLRVAPSKCVSDIRSYS